MLNGRFIFGAGAAIVITLSVIPAFGAEKVMSVGEITKAWKTGQTLPESVFRTYKLPQYDKSANDNGINVLFDSVHEFSFAIHWGLSHQVREGGFRSANTQATFDTVLTPGKLARVRVEIEKGITPFAWWTLPEFNVVVTHQGDASSPKYLPEEIVALKKFVEDGGGLVIFNNAPNEQSVIDAWSYNHLFKAFGAEMSPGRVKSAGKSVFAVKAGPEWEVLKKADSDESVRVRRTFGKGRVVIMEEREAAIPPGKGTNDEKQAIKKAFNEILMWVSAGKKPVGGDHVMPSPRGGGGGIYPNLEARAEGLVIYYAKNQTPQLLNTVKTALPFAGKKTLEWLPTVMPEEPVYFILASGGGGGWAVNAFLPKETGVICLDPIGLIGVYGHEIGHTMGGPRNAKGEIAGRDGINQGEAHAGWLQGKCLALFDPPQQDFENRHCNSIMKRDAFLKLDLADKEWHQKFSKGEDWTKLWWIWQKLDDRYGPTWFPRWYWVRSTRFADDPQHQLTMDETVECMSIAVGEDLFPFFKKLGTTLSKERLPEIMFEGQKMILPEAKLDLSPAGKVNLSPIGDYTKPLKY